MNMKKVLSYVLAAFALVAAAASCEEYENGEINVDSIGIPEDIVAGDVEAFKAALADPDVKEIVLPYGLYEGVFLHTAGPKTIKAEDKENPAIIRGKIGVAADVAFENIAFDVHGQYSLANTGHQYLDKYERKSIVPVYASEAKFKNCAFINLYDEREVVAINYGAHKANTMLQVDSCYFQGYAYAIYSRALVSVTNSAFNQEHTQVNPRAIFLYGLGDGNQGNVVFQNNVAMGKTSYTMQMMSKNYDYKKIHYDVRNNENFDVDGEAFAALVDGNLDYTGTTFADGSMKFNYGQEEEVEETTPVGDVAAFKAALADPEVTEIVLPYGIYEGVFLHDKAPKTIKSADPAKPATIKGKIGVAKEVKFENIHFDVSDEFSPKTTGHNNVDGVAGRQNAIVVVYAAPASFEGCKFYNIRDERMVAAIHYGAHVAGATLNVNNCYFEGYAYTIYTRALVSVTNSTFNQTHSTANPRAIFLYGLADGNKGNVVFTNNVAAGKTSYTMEMSSSTYEGDYTNIHYNVQGNTNFSVDGEAFLPRIEEGWDFTGTTFEPGSETFDFPTAEVNEPAFDAEAFKAALADPSIEEIVLPAGVYEGLFFQTVSPKTIKSADPANPATIVGKVAVTKDVTFENVNFDVHTEYSKATTGISDIDRKERDAIVAIATAQATFEGCKFFNLYDERVVVAINYGAYKVGSPLVVNNCYFEGYAYAIYTRALVSVTNSTFKQTHNTANPRALFLYGLDGEAQGNVVFQNNTAAGKTSYTMQMMSTTYTGSYKKIHYDVKNNTNFDVDGQAFLPNLDGSCDFTGTTFAEGSMTFKWEAEPETPEVEEAPAGDVAAFKAALADPTVTEIVLPYGVYEGLFVQDKCAKVIKSADPAKPATIKGKVAVSKEVKFENIVFDVHDTYSTEATGNAQIDKIEGRRKAIVTIYAAAASFEDCKFYNLYDERMVVAIHYGAHVAGATLNVDNCYFEGYAYAIYTRALVSVTNSTFKQTHSEYNPRAIFLYGMGDGKQGNVVFKNNVAAGKTSYAMQMSSSNYDYKKIHYDVQGNTNFNVDGETFLANTALNFEGTTFAEGSETFEF